MEPQAGRPLPAFFCPITGDIMRDPVTTADGQTYERAAIQTWLERSDTSPAAGARLPSKTLTPNIALRQAIEEWEQAYALCVRRADIEIQGPAIASGSFKTVYRGTLRQYVQGGGVRTVLVAVLKMRRGDCATEASIFVKLGRHPTLVRFVGQCIDGDDHILLTELAPFGSLCEAFETWEDTITLDHNLFIMQQIADGLAYLIDNGIVHRDVAARNALVFAFEPEVRPEGLGIGMCLHKQHTDSHTNKQEDILSHINIYEHAVVLACNACPAHARTLIRLRVRKRESHICKDSVLSVWYGWLFAAAAARQCLNPKH
jgi:hypothetical protein